jgi:phosphomannomutase/phosphoglucomutase
VNPRIFREYDIRGEADVDLDDTTVRALGVAIGEQAGAGPVVVARDPRLHSPRLFAALTDGIRARVPVIDLGIVPSPLLYFAARELAPPAAVIITGSHNPPEDNGFKIMLGADTIHGAQVVALRTRVEELIAQPAPPPVHAMHSRDVISAYLDAAAARISLGERRFRVVVDGGNGAGGPIAEALYKRLGFDLVPLYCDLDGNFPHHHPDPTEPYNLYDLIKKVREVGAEIGLALDGDGDRLGAVDGTGRILWGDQLMILLGKGLLAEVPGATFVGEVKCSQTMFDALAAAGGKVEMWKVGHSLIKARMKEIGAHLAGEMSGHLFFAHRWYGFDDATYAGARLLELLTRSTHTLEQLASELPAVINTPEIRLPCPDDVKFAIVEGAIHRMRQDSRVLDLVTIDGVRARFEGGWGLLRASNTQPALVMRCEADTEHRLHQIRAMLEEHIGEVKPYQ